SLGNLISRCKCTGMSIKALLRANGRNDTAARPDAEAKIRLLDRVWDMYSMTCDYFHTMYMLVHQLFLQVRQLKMVGRLCIRTEIPAN
ncbi:MAG: hypothetical protein IKI67_03190, partial [Bacteroidales bacterium]|nr:hypothetical protein [Bacteroidales bacterium]